MLTCAVCLKFSAFINEDRLCRSCQRKNFPKTHRLKVSFVGTTKAIPYDESGRILSHSKWTEIKKRAEHYYNNISSDDIEAFNAEIKTRVKKKIRMVGDEGYIYLLSSSVGLYKIGRAADLQKRFSEHTRDWPIRLDMIHSIPVSQVISCETYLLRTFRNKRRQGEWFDLAAEDVAWIVSLDTESLENLVADALGI